MKQIPLILSSLALILAGIGIFSKKDCNKNSSATSPITTNASKSQVQVIAYFDSDTLLEKLVMFQQGKKAMEKKQANMENELLRKQSQLEDEFRKTQENAQNMTRNELEAAKNKLGAMEQELMMKKDKLAKQLSDELVNYNQDLYKKVTAYLKEFNHDNRFSYILSKNREANIFYADSTLNITNALIEGLNKKHPAK